MTDAVTDRSLNLTLVDEEPRELTAKVIYRERVELEGGEIEERFVRSAARRFPIAGSLSIPEMSAFLRLETAINDALAADDSHADEQLRHVMDRAHARIVGLILAQTPHAFAPAEEQDETGRAVTVFPTIELSVSQILVLLAWIAGDVSVADRVAKALTGGRSDARTADEVEAGDGLGDGPGGAADPATPLASNVL